MNDRILKLHLSQVKAALDKARNNIYSDKLKGDYQTKLFTLFNEIERGVVSTNPSSNAELFAIKKELEFISKSLEFLDSSTLNLIPYEMVKCLSCAMQDWKAANEKYIIATSLVNEVYAFAFDPSLVYNDTIYKVFETKYNVLFEQKLVLIKIPRSLSKDYLIGVVLYHELGHFIDTIYSITLSITKEIADKLINKTLKQEQLDDLLLYFPFLINPAIKDQYAILNFHLGEYFCDLFGAQYIGRTSNYYLNYLTEEQNSFSRTHPSSTNRYTLVCDFLDKKQNHLIDIINNGIQAIHPQHKLELRSEKLSSTDFKNLIPINLLSERQLHGVFELGWNLWLEDDMTFHTAIGENAVFDKGQIYNLVNNLIEKSIGNYIIQERWNRT